MLSRGFVYLILITLLDSALCLSATEKYLINAEIGLQNTITGICMEKGRTAYSMVTVCQDFDPDGGAFDSQAKVIRGIIADGETAEIELEDVTAVEIQSNYKGIYSKDLLKTDALHERERWQPQGEVVGIVLISGEVIELNDVSTAVDSRRRVITWFRIDESFGEISFAEIFYIQMRKDFSPSTNRGERRGGITGVILVSGEVIEFSDVSPNLDMDRHVIRWTRLGEEPDEIPLTDLSCIQINSNTVPGAKANNRFTGPTSGSWFAIGLGGSSVGASFSVGVSHHFRTTHLITLRYMISQEWEWEAAQDQLDTIKDAGLLYGKVLVSSRSHLVAILGGIAVVSGRQTSYDEFGTGKTESFGPNLGLPLEALWHWRLTSVVGIDTKVFANINPHLSPIGIVVSFTLGG